MNMQHQQAQQETMQRILAKKRRGEELTEDDIAVYNQANETLNAINAAKIQPGTTINPAVAPEVLQPKPQQVTSPPLGKDGKKQVSDADLINKYLPK